MTIRQTNSADPDEILRSDLTLCIFHICRTKDIKVIKHLKQLGFKCFILSNETLGLIFALQGGTQTFVQNHINTCPVHM